MNSGTLNNAITSDFYLLKKKSQQNARKKSLVMKQRHVLVSSFVTIMNQTFLTTSTARMKNRIKQLDQIQLTIIRIT